MGKNGLSIGIILPSRGVLYSETAEYIHMIGNQYHTELYMSHNLPIPECYNKLTNEAVKGGHSYLFFIEEDMRPPDEGFTKMLLVIEKGKADAACIDYGYWSGWNVISYSLDGELIGCGTGCLLVKRAVFDKIPKPYFRTDRRYDPQVGRWYPVDPHGSSIYGGQDFWLCYQMRKAGFRIVQVEGQCRHLAVRAFGNKCKNVGFHDIVNTPIRNKLLPVEDYLKYEKVRR